MKVAIYSPYLDTLGGGECYMMTIAEILSGVAQVDLLLDHHLYNLGVKKLIKSLSERFDLDLSKVHLLPAPIGKGTSFTSRIFFLMKYDFLFYLTDGSIFYSTAKNNIVHFQVPFENIDAKGLWGRIKLSSWKTAICNSHFTATIIEKNWPIKVLVIYPPVSTDLFKPSSKKNQIVSVGRFFGFLKDKKHSILIEVFKQMVNQDNNLKSWSLHLAGATTKGDQSYLSQLKRQSQGYNVHFYPNISLSKLQRLYGESTIYWHASGFGENDPKKFEHFGIATVEAMAAGCVPVVINLGGQKEIVENSVSGFLWNNLNEFKKLTLKVITDDNLRKQMTKNAQKRAKFFGKQKFIKNIKELIYAK